MRVLICAGRHYTDSRQCRRVLDAFQRLHSVQVLIHGGNQYLGADIEEWAREHGADIVRYPPNWQRTANWPNACATTSCCSTAGPTW